MRQQLVRLIGLGAEAQKEMIEQLRNKGHAL
jgi:hypothetical protein